MTHANRQTGRQLHQMSLIYDRLVPFSGPGAPPYYNHQPTHREPSYEAPDSHVTYGSPESMYVNPHPSYGVPQQDVTHIYSGPYRQNVRPHHGSSHVTYETEPLSPQQ